MGRSRAEREREEHIERMSSEQGVVERAKGIWHPAVPYGGRGRKKLLLRFVKSLGLMVLGLFALLGVVGLVDAFRG